MEKRRKPYPSDVCDEEWSLLAPYLTLLPEDAGQREHSLREVFNGLRYIVKTGVPWRWMPNDLPPWPAVYQQTQRWLAAGCFEALIDDLRVVLRLASGRKAEPSAAIIDSRTLRSKAASAVVMMEPSARKAPRCISRSIRLATCWPCMSRLPALRTAVRSKPWPEPFRPSPTTAWK